MATKKPIRRRSSILPKDGGSQVGNFSTRFSLPSFVKRVNKLTHFQRDVIRRMGFGNLLSIPNQMLSKNLLVELMERWSPDKHAFLLVPGELTITLLDVALILGLRVTGDPAILKQDAPFLELEKQYGAALWNRKITVSSLEERLEALGETDDDDFARTFLLFIFGTILFPNTNGKVDSRYLSLLQDLNKVCHYAWGAAVLEDLYNWLSKRKEMNVQYVGGCLILLQIWSYEHIDIARPCMRNHPVKFPRACRWENSKSHQRQWFVAKLKELELNQIVWNLELTSDESDAEIIKELPEALRERTNIHPKLRFSADNSSAIEHNVGISHDSMEQLVHEKNGRGVNIMKEDLKNYSIQLVSLLNPGIKNERGVKIVKEEPKNYLIRLNPGMVSTGQTHFSSTSYGVQDKEKPNEHLQVPQDDFSIVIDDAEDDLVAEHCVLKEENIKLRTENNDLREEIALMKSKLSLTTELEQQNERLRKEVETLRRQNSSVYSLVTRLEDHINDNHTEDQMHCRVLFKH